MSKPRIYLHHGFGIRGPYAVRWNAGYAALGFLTLREAMTAIRLATQFLCPYSAVELLWNGYTTGGRR